MSRRTTATLLLLASTLLCCTRYLSAAIFGSSISSWDADLFNAMLQYVGPNLVLWSRVALVGGIVYLVWAEVDSIRASARSSKNH